MLGHIWNFVTGGMASWYRMKMFVEHASVITSDSMHVLAGMLIFLLSAVILRRSILSWLPWLIVLALAVANEIVDLWVEQWPDLAMQYGESAKDLLLTMTLPTVLLLAARFRPQLFRR